MFIQTVGSQDLIAQIDSPARVQLADASPWKAPVVQPPSGGALGQLHPGSPAWSRVPFGAAAALLAGSVLLNQLSSESARAQVGDAIQRFGLDGTSGPDVLAARAYVWGKNLAPMAYWSVPWNGEVKERVAQALMHYERVHPGTLGQAEAGDPSAKAAIDQVVSRALEAAPADSAIETRTQEERDLVDRLKAQGKGSQEIQDELLALRGLRSAGSLQGDEDEAAVASLLSGRGLPPEIIRNELQDFRADGRESGSTPGAARNQPGVAHISAELKRIDGPWLRGTQRNAGLFPAQVAEKLEGRQFNTYGEFRRAVWKAVADTPELASQFPADDQALMRRGCAPLVDEEQRFGEHATYQLHHEKPIAHGGGVYDMSNLKVVTPRMHQDILDSGYHFGGDK